ncbi:general transcription factor IIIA, b [Stigmatopora argus]
MNFFGGQPLKMGERLPGSKRFLCSFSDCQALFTKLWKLEAHLCKHTGSKPFSCENCDKSFRSRQQLARHELGHGELKPHECPTDGCFEAFVRRGSLKKHIVRAHQHQIEEFQCTHEDCQRRFRKKYQLKAHMGEHQGLLAFCCHVEDCAKEFPSRAKLKHHDNVHKGYPCEEELCPFLGKTWSGYRKHRQVHRVKLPCQKCKKEFNNRWFLRQHEFHSHAEGKRDFSCPKEGCARTYTRRFNLDEHVLGDHEGKKPFSCTYAGCSRSFAMKESLWRHGVVHDPLKQKLKKLNPRKWNAALAKVRAAVGVGELSAKLCQTHLGDPKS